jgi:hypothetical protein
MNQEERPVHVADGTSVLGASPNPRSTGNEQDPVRSWAASPKEAAFQALQYVEDMIERQNLSVELTGVGQYFGTQSDFAAADGKHREARLRRMAKPGVSPGSLPSPQPMNCVELLFGAMTVYRDSQLRPWSPLIGKARDAGSRGTVLLAEARREDHFVTWYYSRDVKHDEDYHHVRKAGFGPPGGHRFVRGEQSHRKIDVTVRIDQWAINFAPDPKTGTKKETGGLEALKRVPFGIGAADWGAHTFIFSYGSVYEAHWESEPNNRKKPVFEKTPFEDFTKDWPSGVIAVPPGSW